MPDRNPKVQPTSGSGNAAKLPVSRRNWPMGRLSEKEWRELVALEYVLTWGYSKNEAKDEKRYKKLSNRK